MAFLCADDGNGRRTLATPFPETQGLPPPLSHRHGRRPMIAIVNVVLPVFGIILAGYLCGRFRVLGEASSEALNRFVYSSFPLNCRIVGPATVV
jgi:hypothetical protein